MHRSLARGNPGRLSGRSRGRTGDGDVRAEVEALRDQRLGRCRGGECRKRLAREREKTRSLRNIGDHIRARAFWRSPTISPARSVACPAGPSRATADASNQMPCSMAWRPPRAIAGDLERYGVKPIEGRRMRAFDPNLHQAIAEVPGNGSQPGTRRGCRADRVI